MYFLILIAFFLSTTPLKGLENVPTGHFVNLPLYCQWIPYEKKGEGERESERERVKEKICRCNIVTNIEKERAQDVL